jgi:hypothetical protein
MAEEPSPYFVYAYALSTYPEKSADIKARFLDQRRHAITSATEAKVAALPNPFDDVRRQLGEANAARQAQWEAKFKPRPLPTPPDSAPRQ